MGAITNTQLVCNNKHKSLEKFNMIALPCKETVHSVHVVFGTIMFHFRRAIKRPGSSLSHQLYKTIKWVNGCWCVGHRFLPSHLQGHRESAKESMVQRGCVHLVTGSQYLITTHTQRQTTGELLAESCFASMLSRPRGRRGAF